MKTLTIRLITLSAIAAGITACSTADVSILPKADGSYTAISASSTAHDSIQGATDKAQATCQAQKKTYKVISSQTKYTGPFDRQTKAAINLASSIANDIAFSKGNGGAMYPNANSRSDFTTKMNFRCE